MNGQLPPPLQDYFAAVNRHDVGATLLPFAEDAIVRDEGRTHNGRAGISSWIKETTEKYRVTADVTEVTTDGDEVKVAALVSGNFPGSPITLRYAFTLRRNSIARLEIGV